MKRMSLGAHTFGFAWTCDALKASEMLAGQGFDQIELMATPPHFDPWADNPALMAELRRSLEKSGTKLLALDLASSDVNLASPSADAVEFAVEAYRAAIARCDELGATGMCVGSGRRHALLASANLRLKHTFKAAFDRIHAEADRRGVALLLENHPQGLLADAGAIDAFLSSGGYDDIQVIYDVANAFAVGEEPVAGLAILLPKLGIVHLSDSPKDQWRHDPIGAGDIDFAEIARFLTQSEFAGPVVLEIISENPLGDLLSGVDRLRQNGWRF
jgi:sugar phosphate isomerase/epimerase